MKRVVLFFLAAISFPATLHAKTYGDVQGAVYISSEDAKTLKMNLPESHPLGETITVHVEGIDTPNAKGKCEKETYNAVQASEMAKDILADAEQIDLRNLKRGEQSRVMADVIVDDENLADILIEAGMAVRSAVAAKPHDWCE